MIHQNKIYIFLCVYCNSIVKEIEQSSFVQVFIVLIILNMSMKLTLKLITNYIKVEKAQSVHLGLNPHYQCPTRDIFF